MRENDEKAYILQQLDQAEKDGWPRTNKTVRAAYETLRACVVAVEDAPPAKAELDVRPYGDDEDRWKADFAQLAKRNPLDAYDICRHWERRLIKRGGKCPPIGEFRRWEDYAAAVRRLAIEIARKREADGRV